MNNWVAASSYTVADKSIKGGKNFTSHKHGFVFFLHS